MNLLLSKIAISYLLKKKGINFYKIAKTILVLILLFITPCENKTHPSIVLNLKEMYQECSSKGTKKSTKNPDRTYTCTCKKKYKGKRCQTRRKSLFC